MGSAKKKVELEIVEEWWWWHGYRPFSRNEERTIDSPETAWGSSDEWYYIDDMDDSADGIPFPLIKPSIDVFGVPRQSRKQRGWYQVRSPSRLLPGQAAMTDSASLRSPRSAADIPPELVAAIVAELGSDYESDIIKPVHGRRELARCASVCRHWSRILQPLAYNWISIASTSDVIQLQSFYDAPSSAFPRWKVHFELRHSLASPPFLHLLPLIKSLKRRQFDVTIFGPLSSKDNVVVRSIHSQIPRQLPRTHFAYIRKLALSDIHFQYFVHLARLVWDLVDLERFQGSRLTWKKETRSPTISLAWSPARRRRVHPDVDLDGCLSGQHWLAMLLTGWLSLSDEPCVLIRLVDELLPGAGGFGVSFYRTARSILSG